MLSKRFYGAALGAALVLPSIMAGCSDEDNPLCCNEFKAGASVDVKIGGSAQAQVAVQAVADFSGIASAAIDDLTTACRSIATDLDVAQADRDAAEANTDKQARMKAYCQLAVSAIGTVKGSATLSINAAAPQCSASVSAKADCQAKCNGGVKCDFKANPPTCSGGKLEIACKGGCTASAQAPSVSCEGSCEASCSGSCTVTTGSVRCAGKCNGTCSAGGQAGDTGIQADGTCKGECAGTCEVTAPGANCTGSCQGQCTGKCTATGGVAVKCDGTCDADFEPIKCEGGELSGGCNADVKCDANCSASVKAKAECTPPSLTVTFSGGIDAQAAGKLRGTIEANFGVILAFKSRLEGMASVAATISGSADAVVDIKAACIPQVVAAGAAAVSDVAAAVEATGSLAGSVSAG